MSFSWTYLLAVLLGGGGGAVLRWLLGVAWGSLERQDSWPWPTLICNLAGSLLIGGLHGWWFGQEAGGLFWRLLLVTGLLGGFTTFSAFSFETLALVQRGLPALAAGYALVSVAAGLGCALLGWWMGRAIS